MSSAASAELGLIIIGVLMVSTGLPALSGILLWIRRCTLARLWAADELIRGRVLAGSVSVSLLEGAMAGAAMAGIFVLADLIGLRIAGFLPSISREVDVVDKGVWAVLFGSLSSASLLAVGIALAVEALDRARVAPVASTALIAITFGVMAGAEHQTVLAVLPPMAGQAVVAAMGVMVYRTRGLLANFIAVMVSDLLLPGMAARALDDPGLESTSHMLFGIVGALAALGLWGLIAARLKRKHAVSTAPA